MKLLPKMRKFRWGIAMTEYLIILGIVAIAAIAIVGLFGKQIKNTFYRSTSTLGGTDANAANASTITGSSSSESSKTDSMGNFDKNKNSSGGP